MQRHGGGGHKKAGGCTIADTMENVYALIKHEMEIALKEYAERTAG